MDPELQAALERMESGLRQHIDATAESLAATLRAEIRAGDEETRRLITAGDEETRRRLEETHRHLGVLIEATQADVRLVAEGVVTLNDETRRRVDLLEARVTVLERDAPGRPRRRRR